MNLLQAEYRVKFMPQFPFVIIDSGLGARDLFIKKPFLFRIIMLVAIRVPLARRKSMKRSVMAYLGQHLLVEEERSLDLLQGLLVFLAW